MIPRTFPSIIEAFQTKMVVYVLPSVSGLTAWIDYIPVKGVVTEDPVLANTYANAGYQVVKSQESLTGQAWLDYIPVYEDAAYDKPWSTDAGGYIPVGGLFSPASLFAAGEQGWWYDPSDINRYTQLGPELVTNGTFDTDSGWTKAGNWTISDGVALWTPALGSGGLTQTSPITLSEGMFVEFTFDLVSRSNGQAYISVAGSLANNNTEQFSIPGTYTRIIKISTVTNQTFGISVGNSPNNISVDNISIKELTAIDTATLFQDSAGTTPVTAMEQPVGLQLDLSKGLVLGPEEVTNGDFATDADWTTGAGWTIGSGVASRITGAYSVLTYTLPSALTAGKWYLLEMDKIGGTNSTMFMSLRGGATVLGPSFSVTNTRVRCLLLATANHTSIGVEPAGSANDGTIDNISVRELPGNHRFQSTSANRPVVSARVNLLTKTEQFDDAAWTKTGSTISANTAIAPNGTLTADKIVESALNERHGVATPTSVSVAGTLNTFTIRAKASERSRVKFLMSGSGNSGWAWFDLLAVTTTVGNSANDLTCSIAADAQGFFLLTVQMTPAVSGTVNWDMLDNDVTPSRTGGYLGDGTSGLFVWGADARVTNQGVNLPVYQRVNTSTDYDSTGFPVYIKPNGSNQFMQTNSINFTATDKMTVWQGVRKLSDAAAAILMELSANVNSNNGSFGVLSPQNSGVGNYGYVNKGTVAAIATAAGFSAPITNVLTTIGNISGDQSILRLNAIQAAINTADQGTGNYGNYPTYFYARAGTSLFFNGHDYGSIARGAASTAAQIANGETYINKLTKAF
jgi:hypothetical protein